MGASAALPLPVLLGFTEFGAESEAEGLRSSGQGKDWVRSPGLQKLSKSRVHRPDASRATLHAETHCDTLLEPWQSQVQAQRMASTVSTDVAAPAPHGRIALLEPWTSEAHSMAASRMTLRASALPVGTRLLAMPEPEYVKVEMPQLPPGVFDVEILQAPPGLSLQAPPGHFDVQSVHSVHGFGAQEKQEKAEKSSSGSGSESGSQVKPPKTYMLGNLPYRVTNGDIMDAMDFMGFKGGFHICHMPNANRRKPRATNLGYAFISFDDAAQAASFVASFGKFHFPGNASEKQCTLKAAHFQCCATHGNQACTYSKCRV